jgi:hypothetical protein
MLQILYIVAFTALSLFAVVNLIRSMISLGQSEVIGKQRRPIRRDMRNIHPELLDESGNITNEPLLVMRSMSFDDARSRLDALYESSPGNSEH